MSEPPAPSDVAAADRYALLRKIAQAGLLIGILVYLAYRLSDIGWGEVWANLPTEPLFYGLFVLLYLSIPIGEVFIYGYLWPKPKLCWLPMFIKKRVYNKDVMGYSGEVYLFMALQDRVAEGKRAIARIVRDVNVLSVVASTFIALVLLALFLTQGRLSLSMLGLDRTGVLIGAVVVIAVGIGAWQFRRHLFSLSRRQSLVLLGIFCIRLVLAQAVQIAMWRVALPEVELSVWFTYAAIGLMLSRIPFLPNQDLIFLGIGVELSGLLDLPESGIAALLLTTSVLDKVLNATLFGIFSFTEPKPPNENAS
ncbi:MAG: hypothetical protein RhofKO_33790 [Rhodothermales bacterium]